MNTPKKKKGILDSLIDAVTDRDEKAAEAAAKAEFEAKKAAEAEAARKHIESVKAEAAAAKKAAADAAAKKAADAAAAKTAADAAAKKAAEEKAQQERIKATVAASQARLEQQKAAAAAAAEAEKARFITMDHKVGYDDTLSGMSLHYYGTAVRDYWWLIYEANKDVIGDDYKKMRPGMVLKIPKLSDEQKADIKKRKSGSNAK